MEVHLSPDVEAKLTRIAAEQGRATEALAQEAIARFVADERPHFPAKSKRLTIENVNLDDECEMDAFVDHVLSDGIERVRAEGDELRRRGLLDSQGNLLVKELPADMKEGADRDFGG